MRRNNRAPARALLLASLLVATTLLAGCAEDETVDPAIARALANTRAMDWTKGNWWSYEATLHGNRTFQVALVVHERTTDGFRIGSNLSNGFFGLPFTGNVTPGLNPRIGAEEWPLYHFPLHDGKTWDYTLMGYDAKATAHAALLQIPGRGPVPGFRLEATAYGQVFARYDYSPTTGWFTHLELIEPTNRKQILVADLQDYGNQFGSAYYIEKTLKEFRIDYPSTTIGPVAVNVPPGYAHLRAHLSASLTAGTLQAKLTDAQGREMASVNVQAKGAASDDATPKTTPRGWRLEHAGAGIGVIHLEITGVTSTGNLPPARDMESANLSLTDVLGSRGTDLHGIMTGDASPA